MAKYELSIYGENDELIKKYETDHVLWGIYLDAVKLHDEIKEKTVYEQFEALNEFIKKFFHGLTDEELKQADVMDVLNTFKQLISVGNGIESSKNA